jgi:type IX secretion system substrate protein/WD40 repeat protein
MGWRVGFITSCACASFLFAAAVHAQSATIVVAPIAGTVAGDSITLHWTVTNTGVSSRTFGVGAEIRQDSAVLADLSGQTTPILAPGTTASSSFGFVIPTWWSGGAYVARAAVWTGSAGSSTWLNAFDRGFDVEQVPLATAGRVVYHAYSDYMALPVEEDDGHVLLWSLPAGPIRRMTDGLAVENAVNPHFSPDGSRVTFTALPRGVVPPGTARSYASLGRFLEIFVYDLARDSLARLTSNDVADEDGKFSPDGRNITFKRDGQIWVMAADGGGAARLTASGSVKSGPGFSPDGNSIVYSDGVDSQADIWRMSTSGSDAARLVGAGGLQDYYPVHRDAQTVLFCRWESASDRHDKVFTHSLASGISRRLPLNLTGVEDADPFPVDAGLVGFSSTRRGGSYDLYFGDPSTGLAYPVGMPNLALQELGGGYTPYQNARALTLVSPGATVQRMAGNPMVVSAKAFANGGVWAEAAPTVVLQGPTSAAHTLLHDDGIEGDLIAGDGMYSAVMTLPAQAGAAQAYVTALSSDNGLTQELRSASVLVTLTEQLPAPVVSAATGVTGNSFTTHWSPAAGATGYRLDVATDAGFDNCVSGYRDLDVGNVDSWEVTTSGGSPTHFYRVRAYNGMGTGVNSGTMTVATVTAVTLIDAGGPAPFHLDQNLPNPFGSLTNIGFAVPRRAMTSLRIYDVRGVQVATLIEREIPAGRYRVRWDASHLPTGAYFCRLQSGAHSETRKLLMRK